MFFGDAKSLRRKLCRLQNKLQVAEDFVFFAGGQGFVFYGLPKKLAVDLAVYLVADGQQRVTVASFRYRQMIGKIVTQTADAPVEHRDVLVISQLHIALQTLDPLQLVFLPGNSDQQIQRDQKEYDHYNVCVEQGVACASFIEQKKLPLIDEHDDDLADVDQESDPHEEQAKVFRDLAEKPVQRFAKQYYG